MRRKPVREKRTPAPPPAGAPAGIALPTLLSATVTGGSVLALALAGSLVVGGTAMTFGSTTPVLHHRGPVATAPRPLAAPVIPPPPEAPARVSLVRHTTTVGGRSLSGGAGHEDENRNTTATTHRPRKEGRPTPGSGRGGGRAGGGGGTATDPGDGGGAGGGGTPDDGGNHTPDDGGNHTPDDGGNHTPDGADPHDGTGCDHGHRDGDRSHRDRGPGGHAPGDRTEPRHGHDGHRGPGTKGHGGGHHGHPDTDGADPDSFSQIDA